MKTKKTIQPKVHITDAAVFIPKSGVRFRRIRLEPMFTGSAIGRFIFTEYPPMILIRQGIQDTEISYCDFDFTVNRT